MASNKLAVYVHFVWATRGREPTVEDDIRRRLHRYIWACCEEKGCKPLAIGGTDDHVHLLVTMSATITMAGLMRAVKGGSSHFVSETLRPGEGFAWQGGYGAFSVTARDRSMVVSYIDNQIEHHKNGRIWPAAEPDDTSPTPNGDDRPKTH